MTETQLKLLRDIARGEGTFTPKDNNIEGYKAFQPIADAFARLEVQGYIRKCEIHYENRTGMKYIDRIVVRNALTSLGKKFLEKNQ